MSLSFNALSRFFPILLLALVMLAPRGSNFAAAEEPTWSLQPNDRILLVGSTFIERENQFGTIELSLRTAFPQVPFTIRNIGWSGDNILGESRAYFGTPEDGARHRDDYLKMNKPTLVIVSYGHNAAFSGPDQLDNFINKYEALLKKWQQDGRRFVLLGLTPLEAVVTSPDLVKGQNSHRKQYNEAIGKLAHRLGYGFVDLFNQIPPIASKLNLDQLTYNGVHLNQDGYIVVGEAVCQSLGNSLIKNSESLMQDSQFLAAAKPVQEKIDWKNELYFHRFRPQNETYLRGFRKHEQGQNEKEIYEFDALIEAEDQELQQLTQKILTEWSPGSR